MSLPQVEVNMAGIFTTGQAYVALSRAMSAEGLTVTGYHKKLVYANPAAILFYEDIQRGEVGGAGAGAGGGGGGDVTTSVHDLCQ